MSRRNASSGARAPRALVAAVALVALGVAVWHAVPWATKERTYLSSVPQPPPVLSTAVVAVSPRESICLENAAILPDSDLAQFRVGTRHKPAVPLTVTARGPGGYRSTVRIPATWKDNDLLIADIDPPSRELVGEFCVRNDGRRTVDFYAANDRTMTGLNTTVEETRAQANMQLTFVDAQPASILDRTSEILDELQAYRPGWVGPWLLWPLAVLALLVPSLVAVALWRSLRDDSAP